MQQYQHMMHRKLKLYRQQRGHILQTVLKHFKLRRLKRVDTKTFIYTNIYNFILFTPCIVTDQTHNTQPKNSLLLLFFYILYITISVS
jgi:phage-related holin